ncbi:DENN domain-containing protein 3 isoform X1 [Erpetoichthys calabaricus]|uniref:DENN domain-containing protein 3 isoform X1 n=1 Tax=Erpetoichthys calabaricus TaxID=27687 RepID=UPI002234D908|nr:DENN domain-containing protein 3 isoform X1 [Erpetoichthys calabaricus]XP_028673917.2 DENN domain-containing protein 3 isoform X1 [Erpetoichthys calabaricus]
MLMADVLPCALLEGCVVTGASTENLKEAVQAYQGNHSNLQFLDPEVLQVHVPPFVTKDDPVSGSHGHNTFERNQRRRSYIKKKKEKIGTSVEGNVENKEAIAEDISVPKDIDLIALPQLCFPGGLQVSSIEKEDCFHFLVFTDVFGNRSHGVVVQYYKQVQVLQDGSSYQNGQPHRALSRLSKLYAPYAICLISKYAYYNALKDCLSCLRLQLKSCRDSDIEDRIKEFAAKLTLVPTPPPGHLHLVFNMKPLQIILPSQEDVDGPVIDIDLHFPFLCFKPKQVLKIITCILMEQRIVFFSSDWALLTLIAECFMLYIHPLQWQHTFVPILSRQMLDFVMAPTSFLMGCHIDHYEEVATETDDIVLINIDRGTISTSFPPKLWIPDVPAQTSECFLYRVRGLQMHYDLELSHLGASTDLNHLRSQRREWQQTLNLEIQQVTLELIVNIFREVNNHLNYEHRVFNSEEFLKTRDSLDQPFYKKVLETHIFHSFLKARLNRKMDSYTRMEINTRSETHRMRASLDIPIRPTIQEMARKHSRSENGLSNRLGMSMPNLSYEKPPEGPIRQNSLKKHDLEIGNVKIVRKSTKLFKLPEFPPPLVYYCIQNYYNELISLLSKAILSVSPEDSALLARYYYLRGLMNTMIGKRLDALADFQNLYKTDIGIFPNELLKKLVDSLVQDERCQVEKRPELKRLISKLKKENEGERRKCDDHVKTFELPKKHMQLEDFVKSIQESGIVKDNGTIHRLFDALTVETFKSWQSPGASMKVPHSQSVFYVDFLLDGQQKQIDPETFKTFYTFWKESEAEAQDVHLPVDVIDHLDNNECVYKLSCSVKTSYGVGKIAMTQKRLFLLTEGRPGYIEITKFRDIEELKISSAAFLLLRIPSLKIKTTLRKETFEANLKSECDLWHLMVKEMWAGRKMADEHKDPQYMQQALTNALLMDAVVGCLQSQKAIYAASKLAYFDRMKLEVPMMVPKTTSEMLKHKINPSANLTSPLAVDVLLYTPGHLNMCEAEEDSSPKLWCALDDGKVVVFDAASWSLQPNCIQVGSMKLNCMLGLEPSQVWIGSTDSTVYIVNTRSMSCNKQLTDHRSEVTDIVLEKSDKFSQAQAYSSSMDGTVIMWDIYTLKVKNRFHLDCRGLTVLKLFNGTLWCCGVDSILELRKNGLVNRRLQHLDDSRETPLFFNCFELFIERDQLWTTSLDSAEVCIWHIKDLSRPFHKIQLQDCFGVNCMIKVKNQVWIGSRGISQGKSKGKIYVVDVVKYSVEKELVAHTDVVQALCSAEDRYVLSGSSSEDGKIAIWKVE